MQRGETRAGMFVCVYSVVGVAIGFVASTMSLVAAKGLKPRLRKTLSWGCGGVGTRGQIVALFANARRASAAR